MGMGTAALCGSWFSIIVLKQRDQWQPKEEFVLAHGFRGLEFTMAGKAWRQEQAAGGSHQPRTGSRDS